MAQDRSVNPEKQLLKLIEDSKSAGGAGFQKQAIKRQSLSFISFLAWRGRFSFSKDLAKKWAAILLPRILDIRTVNRALIFFIVVSVVYFIINTYSCMISMNNISLSNFKAEAAAEKFTSVAEQPGVKKPASFYAETIKQKNIFKMGARPVSSVSKQETFRGPSPRVIEATQHLRLAGISWSRDPDAMIEDTKAARTYFVKKGEMIGEIKVEGIFKDKVILGFGGEEVEIR
ncbi:MAG: hypothetical protein JW946_04920 [Candidatus Omnitrophica bacterium]|nr:hypothetical protein [Candidatus Omnitrophota bacterium]